MATALGLVMILTAADPEPRWRALNRTAREAVQSKDFSNIEETRLRYFQSTEPGD